MDERKGLGVLLSAFELIQQRLPEARLVLAGEGPLREMIESEIREQGWERSVLLAGFVDDAAAIMQAIDVLLLPSYWEGFGIVILEAMACGRPVITTNISSMPEIVDDGRTGYLIPPGATAALAERAVELLQNKSLRESMGRAGRARVAEHFSHDVMIDRLEKLFHREAHRSG